MTSNSDFGSISFDLPKNQSNVIKVIGVGGGGSNAINHMFKQGIKGVDFVVLNTDSQALQNSPVPNKIQLGVHLTEGLGAGANPEVGQQSAMESMEEIEKMLDSNTKMVFITAGMGGGTGTGAAPVIAEMAKAKDILTVGIVTIPFQFEGKMRYEQAMNGVERLRKQVDSLIVINNNKLREVYGNLGFKAGFSKADEVLATASRGIAEVITNHYIQNIDLKDAKTVLSNSGTAIMGSAVASGENRAKEAILAALDSPLLNDNKISGAKNVLLLIVSGTDCEITIDEIGEISDHIQNEAGHMANIITGIGEDEKLGESVSVTIIATGFNVEQQKDLANIEQQKIIHTLGGDQKNEFDLSAAKGASVKSISPENDAPSQNPQNKIVHELVDDSVDFAVVSNELTSTHEVQESYSNEIIVGQTPIEDVSINVPTTEAIKNMDVVFEIISPIKERMFYETTPEIADIVVKNHEVITPEKEQQVQFTFEIADNKKPESAPTIRFDLDETHAINEFEVKSPIQVVPITELNESGVVRYSLEDYIEVEKELAQAKPILSEVKEPQEETFKLEVKQEIENKSSEINHTVLFENKEDVNPLEMTIEETLRARADERRRKLKEYNYKFHNQAARLDELEREPAYKRQGVDLSQTDSSNTRSRLSLGSDSNDDIQLRSNNSFLHDNVD
jgi:cell division protein FtsZ